MAKFQIIRSLRDNVGVKTITFREVHPVREVGEEHDHDHDHDHDHSEPKEIEKGTWAAAIESYKNDWSFISDKFDNIMTNPDDIEDLN